MKATISDTCTSLLKRKMKLYPGDGQPLPGRYRAGYRAADFALVYSLEIFALNRSGSNSPG
jgi:hypothetical protein